MPDGAAIKNTPAIRSTKRAVLMSMGCKRAMDLPGSRKPPDGCSNTA